MWPYTGAVTVTDKLKYMLNTRGQYCHMVLFPWYRYSKYFPPIQLIISKSDANSFNFQEEKQDYHNTKFQIIVFYHESIEQVIELLLSSWNHKIPLPEYKRFFLLQFSQNLTFWHKRDHSMLESLHFW